MRKIKVLSLFDGGSCAYIALNNIGVLFEYHAYDFSIISEAQAQKIIGNGFQINVIEHILKELLICEIFA